MWKDFFYYSKSERRAVYVLLILIALFVAVLIVLPEYRSLPDTEALEVDSVERKEFLSKIQRGVERKDEPKNDGIPVSLVPFDPNLADSIELLHLGLPKYVVRNILKYRQKGGRFVTPESLGRIYGLTEEKFLELKPYVRISEAFARKPKPNRKVSKLIAVQRIDTVRRAFKYPEGTKVDVNRADTVELKKIPGIGSGIARMIVAYRERLGGFCSLEQLLEVKFVTPELLEWFALEHHDVRKLEINRAGLEKLRAHPYLSFYQAKVIVEHRRQRGDIKSLSQLSLYEEFSEKDLERLSAYVSFD